MVSGAYSSLVSLLLTPARQVASTPRHPESTAITEGNCVRIQRRFIAICSIAIVEPLRGVYSVGAQALGNLCARNRHPAQTS